MKNRIVKVIAIVLACVLAVGGIGGAAYALNQDKTEPETAQPEATPVVAAEPETKDAQPAESETDETVYVLAGADGTVQKIIISNWVKDAIGAQAYTVGDDSMKVWDAEGNALSYQGDAEKELPVGMAVSYQLDGKPISAEALAGKSGKVTIRFDYENKQKKTVKIDGKDTEMYVPFAMLTGLLLDSDKFTNVQVSNGKLLNDGSRIAVLGFAFPGLQENLSVDKDKLEIPDYVEITADVKEFAMGMTMSVATDEVFSAVDEEKLDSYDDLTDSLDDLTGAMGQLMDGSSQLYDGLCTLLDKSSDLVNGIDQLAIGAAALKDGALDLNLGAGKLSTGAIQLNLGQNQLVANNDTLTGGAKQIFDSLLSKAQTQLAEAGLTVPQMTMENYAQVLDGVVASLDEKAVRAQALQTVTEAVEANRAAVTQAVTAAVRAEVAAQVLSGYQQEVTTQVTAGAREQVAAQVNSAVKQQLTDQYTAGVRAQITAKVIPAVLSGMTMEDYEAALAAGTLDDATKQAIEDEVNRQMAAPEVAAQIEALVSDKLAEADVQAQIAATIDTQMATDAVAAQITATVEAKLASDELQTQMNATVDAKLGGLGDTIQEKTDEQITKLIAEQMESDAVKSKLAAAAAGIKTVQELKVSLDGFQTFYAGLGSYTQGVAAAADGSKTLSIGLSSLKTGASKLSDGAVTLYKGILQMKNGAPALVEGVTELSDGALQLSDGLKEFNEKGVQKLVDAAEGDLGDIITRLRATIDLAKDYKSFSDATEKTDGKMKFIYRTDEIKE